MGNYWMYQRELHTLFDYNKTSLGSYTHTKMCYLNLVEILLQG